MAALRSRGARRPRLTSGPQLRRVPHQPPANNWLALRNPQSKRFSSDQGALHAELPLAPAARQVPEADERERRETVSNLNAFFEKLLEYNYCTRRIDLTYHGRH
ncbi:Hypothetical protein NTJ_05520 [Nesidiocoris tenuis]|uniref:Uncharacterized protein n=1 Tax=Nesidiocoris tenuis TaxID=355587 RepID=A0ABN7AKD4_9HEMI|nr:Hypothetical protein NTJ_05520 [Nesidiocoris tenuis]